MKYHSTRNPAAESKNAAEVIIQGLAADGGLFLPDALPQLTSSDIQLLRSMDYAARAASILGRFLTDYTEEELSTDCHDAYAESSFPGGAAPLRDCGDDLYTLELWHGPTAAFKDMALQIMPRLLSRALVKTGETRTALILVATSGDTGKAALEGFKDVPGTKMMVFYPENGVSVVQKRQMQSQTGNNVNVTAIRGNFDDAQTGVKKIFSDPTAAAEISRRGYLLSSANSINWGRLAPQIVYYISAYCDLLNGGKIKPGEKINVTVPTGNFGNIFAAYLAKRMGLPIGRLICASNKNNILTDFLRTGVYDRNRPFYLTMSPSMDILISSNLERLLYYAAGPERTAAYMKQLNETGAYTVGDDVLSTIGASFCGYFADESATADAMRLALMQNYLIDPHTAVAYSAALQYRTETHDRTPMVIASTASPFKFAVDVFDALYGERPEDPLSAPILLAQKTGQPIPYPLVDIDKKAVRFTDVCDKQDMWRSVKAFL